MISTSASTATLQKAARQARVEPVGKVILCYNSAIKTM
jgi:hypothetical protein